MMRFEKTFQELRLFNAHHLKYEGGEDVENDNDSGEMEGDKVEPHPTAPHRQHKALRHHVPLVHNQQVKEYDKATRQIVKVVRTIPILGKIIFFVNILGKM
jgi:hypothetical protein